MTSDPHPAVLRTMPRGIRLLAGRHVPYHLPPPSALHGLTLLLPPHCPSGGPAVHNSFAAAVDAALALAPALTEELLLKCPLARTCRMELAHPPGVVVNYSGRITGNGLSLLVGQSAGAAILGKHAGR